LFFLEKESLTMTDFNTLALEEGNYTGTVRSQTTTTSSKGVLFFEMEFDNLVFQDGSETGVPITGNTTRRVRLPVTKKAADWTKQKLDTIGYVGSFNQFNPEDDQHVNIVGTTGCKLRMKNSDWGEDWDISLGKGIQTLGVMEAKQAGAQWIHVFPSGPAKPTSDGATGNSW
jgi:hypothetical protein